MAGGEGKAAAEIAKTAGKVVDAVRELGGFVAKYVGGTIEQAMGVAEDKLKYLRWERQVRLIDRASEFLRVRGLNAPTRTVPLKIAIPIMQGGSLEEDDSLQDRWAMLLVNAADSHGPEVRRAYTAVLEELTSLDAAILDKLFDADRTGPKNADGDVEMYTHKLPDQVVFDLEGENKSLAMQSLDVEVSLVNLGRIGLICSAMAFGGLANMRCVHMTALGREFIRACRPSA